MDTPQDNLKAILDKISAIKKIYENIQYNKNICISLMDRIDVVDFNITRNLQRNNQTFNAKTLIQILNRTERFMNDISQLYSYMETGSNHFRIEFIALINEFSTILQKMPQWKDNDNAEKIFEHDTVEMTKMTKDLAPKISNFKHSRLSGKACTYQDISNFNETVRWMAPEILTILT
ncbi:11079_t:CDS:2 [Scutellospora calospora]|uniref:11079_t:CDS:1 n=1 Tax=Scutellospora calospora TaxID=85575 RepID=A0ACA9K9F0_9GLOM|nr:11079_t:CDS:2 [Scutellospora calospora]